MTTGRGLVVAVALVLAAAACAGDDGSPSGAARPSFCAPDGGDVSGPSGEVLAPTSGEALLAIIVSNQHLSDAPVHVTVEVDGTRQIDADFCVGTQHNQIQFELSVARGAHTVKAETATGSSIELIVDTTTDQWVLLDYWEDPDPNLIATVFDEQPEFA